MAAPTLAEIEPMLLSESKLVAADPTRVAELKIDGFRLLAEVDGDSVRLKTRQGVDASRWYPEIGRALAGLTRRRTIIDGEVAVLDHLGRADFNALQDRSKFRDWKDGFAAVTLVAFDLIVRSGVDLRAEPLRERKAALARLLSGKRSAVLYLQHVDGDLAPALFQQAAALHLEGIVSKRADSPYRCGERTDDWVKTKRRGATPGGSWRRQPYPPV